VNDSFENKLDSFFFSTIDTAKPSTKTQEQIKSQLVSSINTSHPENSLNIWPMTMLAACALFLC